MILVKTFDNGLVNMSDFDYIKVEGRTITVIRKEANLILNFKFFRKILKITLPKYSQKQFDYFVFLFYREIDFCDKHTGMIDINELLLKTESECREE